jgi:hypothetical protein
MSQEYYVFATKPEAEACMTAINGTSWFPITGNKKGVPNPTATKTTKWSGTRSLKELASGGWAVPRVPTSKLDLVEVPQAERDAFLAVYGNDIRTLSRIDFLPSMAINRT